MKFVTVLERKFQNCLGCLVFLCWVVSAKFGRAKSPNFCYIFDQKSIDYRSIFNFFFKHLILAEKGKKPALFRLEIVANMGKIPARNIKNFDVKFRDFGAKLHAKISKNVLTILGQLILDVLFQIFIQTLHNNPGNFRHLFQH